MHSSSTATALVALLTVSVGAYDGFPNNLTARLGKYIAPGPGASRGPCPGLNTLANHGLIPRDGRNIPSQDLFTAFNRGFGISNDSIETAVTNFEVVCNYANGAPCPVSGQSVILTNLTILGEPHAFEHDHSFSRQDYQEAYAAGYPTDNIFFNETLFGQGLFQATQVLTGKGPFRPSLLTPLDLNAIRLHRISTQYKSDLTGSFQLVIPTQLFEAGFIFGATFDRNSSGDMIGDTPLIRADWWRFWFEEESFPTQLGWVPASTEFFNSDFITSQSSSVLAVLPSTLPHPLPPGATNTTASNPTTLPPFVDPSPNPKLFRGTPYAAPTAPSDIGPEATGQATPTLVAEKRTAPAISLPTKGPALSSVVASIGAAHPQVITSALKLAGPAPPKYNFYAQGMQVSDIQNQVALAQSYESMVASMVVSLASDLLPVSVL